MSEKIRSSAYSLKNQHEEALVTRGDILIGGIICWGQQNDPLLRAHYFIVIGQLTNKSWIPRCVAFFFYLSI